MRTTASRLLSVAGVVLLVGMLPWLSDRDPALSILRARSAEQEATPEALAAIRNDLGLDAGPLRTFWNWLTGLASGNPGTSWNTGKPVLPGALEALSVSLTLMGFAMVVALVTAALVVLPSMRAGLRGTPKRTGGSVAAALTSLPEFLLASVLVVVGAVWLSFPAYGWNGPEYAVLPALALGLPAGGLIGRLLADAVAVTFTEGWVITWTVAGFSRRQIAVAVLRRAVPGLASQVGLIMVAMTGGAVAVEKVFAIPGLGRSTLGDAQSQDLPALQIDILLLLAVSAALGIAAELLRRLLLGSALHEKAMPIPAGVFHPSSRRWIVPIAAASMLAVMVLVGLPRDGQVTTREKFARPSSTFPFGTDASGRDLLARVADGAVRSIGLSLAVTLAALFVGVLLGLIPRATRGLVEVTNAAPPVVTGILIAAIWGPSAGGAAVAVLIVTWAPLAAHTAALVDEARAQPYISILPTLGAGNGRILFGSIVPGVLPAVFRHAMIRLPGVALALAALGFLGLGPQPPTADWGLILSDGVAAVERAPWVAAAPLASLIALAVLAVSVASATSGRVRTTGSVDGKVDAGGRVT
ncbi:ABC transporter permease subunit [Rhodococcoides fascians]|uniref:Nickel transport system permease protein NikB n=1 Tax=Rhodococcoides fascians TaxID=1828 RepID=A0A143QIZ0_RHOFA|nr:ABC transporter permease subunit [Rhodococcus fascians]AMY22899.1 Nickel transport system permease protein NikB [Rhodococcus fascians]KMJ48869.1 ABC transporter permease [Rhodococcus fascians]